MTPPYPAGAVANIPPSLQYITRNKVGGFVLEGANASAEEVDEGTDDNDTESGLDIVLNNRLVETGFKDKKAYLSYLKVNEKTFTSSKMECGTSVGFKHFK